MEKGTPSSPIAPVAIIKWKMNFLFIFLLLSFNTFPGRCANILLDGESWSQSEEDTIENEDETIELEESRSIFQPNKNIFSRANRAAAARVPTIVEVEPSCSWLGEHVHLEVGDSYDKEIPPPPVKLDNGTTDGIPVKFSVVIYKVRSINEIEQEMTIEVRLQIKWLDQRVKYWGNCIPDGQKYISVSKQVGNKLWHPDIFIDYVKEITQPKLLEAAPISLRYYRNGFLRTSTRITIKMACNFHFHYYPLDRQICTVEMKSYAYTTDVLQLQWDKGNNVLTLSDSDMDPPNFELSIGNPGYRIITTGSNNHYAALNFTVMLSRELSYHLIQTYIPSTLFVMISWLSFLVPPESVPGRMTICMTTLLAQATTFAGIRQSIPKVSYVKALDTWMVACIFFVFLTLVEYAVILKLRSLIPKEDTRQKNLRKSSCRSQPSSDAIRKPSANSVSSEDNLEDIAIYNRYKEIVKTTEKYTWICVILLFVIFNIIYWPWLLIRSGYYDTFGVKVVYSN